MECIILTLQKEMKKMNKYKLQQNGAGYDLYIGGRNVLFVIIHRGIMYINITSDQKNNFLYLRDQGKLPELFTVLRQIQSHFSANQIIIVSTFHAMASLLTEEEWGRYGFAYDEAGLLKSK